MGSRLHAQGHVPGRSTRVVPAQVDFLTIYNPSLGDTDETETNQILFWAGKDEIGTSRPGRREEKSRSGHTSKEHAGIDASGKSKEHGLNEQLRQIGLARGMVEFARNFSGESTLDCVETDRSRIVLYELERDWWILASIDLTRLPVAGLHIESRNEEAETSHAQVEYSTREVSPAVLLRTQLIKAHNLFLMHHAANLWELYNKLGRPNFCALLSRFWLGFARQWDVLLHGNPATEVYGDCVKLAGGGELGVGVGEEDWGSGEREVLESFVERSDGLIECIVGRYGAAPAKRRKEESKTRRTTKDSAPKKLAATDEMQCPPWLGAGEDPGPADGVIFSGMGTVSRNSLATISQWMGMIFKHGDSAYGVGENPASRPRQRRTRPKAERKVSDNVPKKLGNSDQPDVDIHPRWRSPNNKAPDWRRTAMENNATPPGIPAPLVSTVERSLHEAIAKASQGNSTSGTRSSPKSSPKHSPVSSPREEKSQESTMAAATDVKDDSSSIFSMGGMKNMLSFGYGSSWTLNPNGFEKKDEQDNQSKSSSDMSSEIPDGPNNAKINLPMQRRASLESRSVQDRLQEIDPNPELSDENSQSTLGPEQSTGKFLIGLSGDLANAEDEELGEFPDPGDVHRASRAQRIFLRTLTVGLANTHYMRPKLEDIGRKLSQTSNMSKHSGRSGGSHLSNHDGPDPKTSAAASVDGARLKARHEKVQVAVYVHQPFIFIFLFELHTAKLTMPDFYRAIHHQLGPLQQPLLQRTDPARVSERMATALNAKASAALSAVQKHTDNNDHAVYDLVHDPSKNTIRTSIPNIPIPASPATAIKTSATVSGAWYTLGIPIGASASPSSTHFDSVHDQDPAEPWTRVEALNVHSQVLNTFWATRHGNELERSVKTAKGWWVLWLKMSAVRGESEELKEAILIRKSADYVASRHSREKRSISGSPGGRWLLRDQSRDVSGGSSFSGVGVGGGGGGGTSTNVQGVSEGVGIDAKKWVEGLLSLTS